uniref:Uncharacterized protein n=1 Tax=Fervidicoccus fontis TaxID=683846 RepID=A0A7C1II17_9CREN
MGRTSPPIRVALDQEAERIRKSLEVIQDPSIRAALMDILRSYDDIIPLLMLIPPQLPIDSILLAALAKLWARVLELERRVASKNNTA